MKKLILILITLMLISLMLNSCTLWQDFFVSDKYKPKKALIQSILENQEDFDSIIKKSRFYDPRFFEFDEFVKNISNV